MPTLGTSWARAWRTFFARRASVLGMNQRNRDLVQALNPLDLRALADDKLVCKGLLEAADVPVARTLAVCAGLGAIPATLAQLLPEGSFVVKPARSGMGRGILVVQERLRPGVWRRAGGREVTLDHLRRHLAEIVFGAFSYTLEDRAFVEERVVPAGIFRDLFPDGLSDIRVIVLEGEPLLAMVRVPTQRSSGRANLHAGGLGLGLDLATGQVTHATAHGRPVAHHPDTGVELVGARVPAYPEVLRVATAAAAALPLGYVGVDVVVDERRGPLVLEVNARAGLEIQNVCRTGLADLARRRPAWSV